jgi:hypothetical protein
MMNTLQPPLLEQGLPCAGHGTARRRDVIERARRENHGFSGEPWHHSIVGGGDRTGKTGRTSSARQYDGRRSSALPDGRPMRKTVGGQKEVQAWTR